MTTTKLPVLFERHNGAVSSTEQYIVIELIQVKSGYHWYAVESWPTRGQAEKAASVIRQCDLESDIIDEPSDCCVAKREDLEFTII